MSIRGRPGPSPRGGKPFGLRTGGELRVCKPFGVGATVNQNSKWKFQIEMSKQSEQARQLVNYYVDQLSGWSLITTRPLFGAVALYRNDHVFAMVWQGALYFKVDDQSSAVYEAAHSQPLGYVSKGEDQVLKSYWEVPADVTEDYEKLQLWAERAYQAALKSEKN
jgi:DNA transformation protein